jgi:hypothetical protein
MGRAYSADGREENAYKVLSEDVKGLLFGKPLCRCEDSISMDYK